MRIPKTVQNLHFLNKYQIVNDIMNLDIERLEQVHCSGDTYNVSL
jgi:hypothetical protein